MLHSTLYFVKFSYRHKRSYLIYNLLYQILLACLTIAQIYLPKVILDELFITKDYEKAFLTGSVLVLGSMTVQLGMNRVSTMIANKKEELKEEFSKYLYQNLASCDYDNMESAKFHDLREKAKNYIGGQWGEFGKILDIIFQFVGDIIVLISVFYLFHYLSIGIVVCYLALFGLNNSISSYYKKKSLLVQMNKMPQVIRRKCYYDNIINDATIGKEIRVFHLTEWILQQYQNYMNRFTETTSKIYRYNLKVKLLIGTSDALKLLVTYGYLVYAVFYKGMTAGLFTMLLNAITLFNHTMNRLITESMDLSRYKTYFAAFLEYVTPKKTMNWGNHSVTTFHKIEFSHVSFRYPGQENYVIQDLSTTIVEHEKIAIVGINGAGKSTMIKLLMGFYCGYEGEIKIDGRNIKDMKEEEYRKLFATVFQDYNLYAFSIRENLCFENSVAIADDEIIDAMKKVGLEHKLSSLKASIDNQVFKQFDSNGTEFSGGEGQRIGIVRAILRKSPIIILDEPTAALDPKAEYEIYQSFDHLIQNQTVIYITHRLGSVKLCNRILVMNQGRIVEEGSHEELLQQDGLYATMFRAQSNFYL